MYVRAVALISALALTWALVSAATSSEPESRDADNSALVAATEDDKPREVSVDNVLEDRSYVDHRKWECFSKPRKPGQCKSSYAFAAISLAEYLYCRQTRELVEFSEQYMIDCGGRMNMNGCRGGHIEDAVSFIAQYGVEKRELYPYQGTEKVCPYPEDFLNQKMGYIKPAKSNAKMVKGIRKNLEFYIELTPILTDISIDSDFFEGNNEVRMGSGCTDVRTHTVLLVGHGRKGGVEYWTVKDSYAPSGYYKVAKDSKCVGNFGVFFADAPAWLNIDFQANEKYVPDFVAHLRYMLGSEPARSTS